MPEYTLLTIAAVVLVVLLDLRVVRTRLLTTVSFWITLGIVWGFQVLVDGWLTKLHAPIVIYDESQFSGVRILLDSPIEDFGFGFAMIVATLMVWERVAAGRRSRCRRSPGPGSSRAPTSSARTSTPPDAARSTR